MLNNILNYYVYILFNYYILLKKNNIVTYFKYILISIFFIITITPISVENIIRKIYYKTNKNEQPLGYSSGGFGKYIYIKSSRLYLMINSKSYLSCNLIITKKC